ncbi:MerR family transcriptional regulator [Geodermatophilus sp. YIM 151500]|uniref:DICT sensory domain-containing protein n=1 Tax=Geodermatophilus sp. YIM 151500 TaxID=2984531 RepID=UPI0021E3D7ED|nr:DICT sensory domain-containing protein [Geodermatophilus sp. YIM 151500]MCV2489625.1 MerR family transcriptional regulator [Geodermatophilus sp. YIM 151500]
MRSKSIAGQQDRTGLSIRDLAERTGVPQATLRSWEARYGVPLPRRLPGGHRRYSDRDVALVEDVLRLRAAGLGLPTAIRDAADRTGDAESSVFAGLRRRHPGLQPQVLGKTTLLALTRAMEDECCARAERPVLLAGFQRGRYYRHSQARWEELARTAEVAVVLADFAGPSPPGVLPVQVPVPATAPLRREWVLVCDAPDRAACVAAWEPPGQHGVPDAARRFETVWSVDPVVVRDAARIGAGVVRTSAPDVARRLDERLLGAPSHASADLRRAAGLLDRMLAYLDAAGRP